MRRSWLILLALPLMAASPPRQQFSLAVPSDPTEMRSFSIGAPNPSSGFQQPAFQPAPLPNRDLSGPSAAPATTEPNLAPTLFTSKTQYRGDGFSPGSTAQSEQERRAKPGAGFSLHMPLTPQ